MIKIKKKCFSNMKPFFRYNSERDLSIVQSDYKNED